MYTPPNAAHFTKTGIELNSFLTTLRESLTVSVFDVIEIDIFSENTPVQSNNQQLPLSEVIDRS